MQKGKYNGEKQIRVIAKRYGELQKASLKKVFIFHDLNDIL